MPLRKIVDIAEEIRLRKGVKVQAWLVEQKDQFRLFCLAPCVQLVLHTVEPDEKAEKPYKPTASLLERCTHAAMSTVLDTKIEIWPIVIRRLILGIRLNIYLNLQIFILLPKLHDLVGQVY